MKNIFLKENFKKIPWIAVAIILVALIALTAAVVAQGQSHQATDAIIPDVVFRGEYRISGGEWQPISNGIHISSTQGNVELKGVFKLYYEGDELGDVESGTVISLHLDHIKATIKDSSGNVWVSDNENSLWGKGACADTWTEYVYEGGVGDEVTIVIYNPHVFGNGKAVNGLLESFGIYNGRSNSISLSDLDPFPLSVGILLTVFWLALLGAAIFATLLRQKYAREVWLLWLLVLFGGIYFIFSRDKISVWIPLHAINTMMLGSSVMLYVLTAHAITASLLSGMSRRIAAFATVLLGAGSLSCIVSSLFPSVKLYNTYPYWTILAVCTALVLLICLGISMMRGDKDRTGRKKFIYVPCIAVLAAFLVDAAVTAFGLWQGGALSLAVLLVIVLISAVTIVCVVPKSTRAVLAAKSIEAEKREMELKLQESHISIMLSQIQPHFLYNTLNSIYQLCETNPMLARSMVNSFSEYLRNNLSTLEETGLISFETELSHIKTYLEIEKIRFEDTLEIEYDIQCVDFSLPVLTVQPIVENAVKHGTSKKRGGGRVVISTLEDAENYIIKVSDTGCGFDVSKPKDDGKRHVGIENVRQRLSNMCGGSLTIESEVGVGTLATIKIPKGSKK